MLCPVVVDVIQRQESLGCLAAASAFESAVGRISGGLEFALRLPVSCAGQRLVLFEPNPSPFIRHARIALLPSLHRSPNPFGIL